MHQDIFFAQHIRTRRQGSRTARCLRLIQQQPAGAQPAMDGLESQVYDVGSSHDITAVSGATMAYLDYAELDCDSIYEIDPSGTTVEIFESEGIVPSSGCHGNAVRYSKTEDVYTFSDHHSDVYVISRAGEVQWRLSDIVPGGSNADWGGAQHGHQLLDNSLLIYANDGGVGSTATEYSLEGERIFHYDSGISPSNLGDVQRLPNGNTLVTYSSASTIHEVTPQGELVLEIDTGRSVGYTLWVPSLYAPPADILL